MRQDMREIRQEIKEVTKHFNYSEMVIDILTICYMALTYDDREIEDIVLEVLSKNFIFFNNGLYNEELGKYYPDFLDGRLMGMYMPPIFDSEGIQKNSFIVINSYRMDSYYELFKTLLHELKHALNNVVRSYINNNGEIYMDCGFLRYNMVNDGVIYSDYFLEEAFNTFMTNIYLDNVLKIKSLNINCAGIGRILDDFLLVVNYGNSYPCVNLLINLFKDKRLFKLFYNAVLYKDFGPLEEELNKIFEKDMRGNKIQDNILDYIDSLLEVFNTEDSIYEVWDYFYYKTRDYPQRSIKKGA